MAKFCPLFSSSSGNSMYIGCGEDAILVDIGVSAKRTEIALNGIGVAPDSIKAVFVTHEHSDHVNGVRVFAKKHHAKVYGSEGTLKALLNANKLDGVECEVLPENGMDLNSLYVKSFRTSHDASESCGYVIDTPDGRKIAVCTDLGFVSEEVEKAVLGCDLVLLESNHDIRMLENGPYPYPLKQRIKSNKGHLSNESSSVFAKKLIESGTTRLILGHLSKENNFPELAYQTTLAALNEAGAKEDSDFILKVARPEWIERAIML